MAQFDLTRSDFLRIYDDHLGNSGEARLTLSEEGLEIDRRKSSAKIAWEPLKLWFENDRFLFLFQCKDYAEVIPKAALSEKDATFRLKVFAVWLPCPRDGYAPWFFGDDISGSPTCDCGGLVHCVRFEIESADVIHALGDLEGDFEADAMPGITTDAVLKTSANPRSGRLRCKQLCGSGHPDHTAPYRFLEKSDYLDWLSGLGTH